VKIAWLLSDDEIAGIRSLVESQRERSFTRNRQRRNVAGRHTPFSREMFWHGHMACLLTTRQRSGPHSPVSRFIHQEPFPFSLEECRKQRDLPGFVWQVITEFGQLRRGNKIGAAATANLAWLEEGGWVEVDVQAAELSACRARRPRQADRAVEQRAANLIRTHMKEFGPKQSRNLWQSLGLSRFEIPIDSRITKWLNGHGFPCQLTANALSDPGYYDFIMDGIVAICKACNVVPCILDAAIFGSYDPEWPEDKWIW